MIVLVLILMSSVLGFGSQSIQDIEETYRSNLTTDSLKTNWLDDPGRSEKKALKRYRSQLNKFRLEYGGSKEMPDIKFYLFGMGNRNKLVYKSGKLLDSFSGNVIRKWDLSDELIIPNLYQVELITNSGEYITIYENEAGVFIREKGKTSCIKGTDRSIILPTFKNNKYDEILKVLHHEILINIVENQPLPNYFVYKKPWRRDAAMMAMCLEKTGNLDLIKNWVINLSEPYDYNNKSDGVPETEADNLGQTLFLLSLFCDKEHELVNNILKEVKKYEVNDQGKHYIRGRSDFHFTPVYQTKWLKYGLKSLGIDDPYTIPFIQDDYSSLFWWDYKNTYMEGTQDAFDEWGKNFYYPYIGWAADHFHGLKRNPISNRDYPLTWEIEASQANYEGMRIIDNIYTEHENSSPHTWHSAEIFLYVLDEHNE